MADWKAIETEYITTNTSYRKLADKYGIDQATISRKAKKEDWVNKRQHHISETQAKILTADVKGKVDRAAKLIGVSDLLLDRVKSLVEDHPEFLMNTQSMKNVSGVLKDIKEIQMIKSQKDLEEQDARIAKLRREAEKEEDSGTEVVITFGSGDAERWAK